MVREQLFSSDSDDAMQRFENYERKLDNLEANVDAQGMGRKRSLAEEIDGLADDEKLDAELADLKKKMAADKAPTKTDKKSSN